MEKEIKLDLKKYAGTYSIEEAKDVVSEISKIINKVKKRIKSTRKIEYFYRINKQDVSFYKYRGYKINSNTLMITDKYDNDEFEVFNKDFFFGNEEELLKLMESLVNERIEIYKKEIEILEKKKDEKKYGFLE
jgi:hypothetical protein